MENDATKRLVKIGQVWQDWDIRMRPGGGACFKVVDTVTAVRNQKGLTVLQDYALVRWCTFNGANLDRKGKPRRIRSDRFKPNSTGYRLLKPSVVQP